MKRPVDDSGLTDCGASKKFQNNLPSLFNGVAPPTISAHRHHVGECGAPRNVLKYNGSIMDQLLLPLYQQSCQAVTDHHSPPNAGPWLFFDVVASIPGVPIPAHAAATPLPQSGPPAHYPPAPAPQPNLATVSSYQDPFLGVKRPTAPLTANQTLAMAKPGFAICQTAYANGAVAPPSPGPAHAGAVAAADWLFHTRMDNTVQRLWSSSAAAPAPSSGPDATELAKGVLAMVNSEQGARQGRRLARLWAARNLVETGLRREAAPLSMRPGGQAAVSCHGLGSSGTQIADGPHAAAGGSSPARHMDHGGGSNVIDGTNGAHTSSGTGALPSPMTSASYDTPQSALPPPSSSSSYPALWDASLPSPSPPSFSPRASPAPGDPTIPSAPWPPVHGSAVHPFPAAPPLQVPPTAATGVAPPPQLQPPQSLQPSQSPWTPLVKSHTLIGPEGMADMMQTEDRGQDGVDGVEDDDDGEDYSLASWNGLIGKVEIAAVAPPCEAAVMDSAPIPSAAFGSFITGSMPPLLPPPPLSSSPWAAAAAEAAGGPSDAMCNLGDLEPKTPDMPSVQPGASPLPSSSASPSSLSLWAAAEAEAAGGPSDVMDVDVSCYLVDLEPKAPPAPPPPMQPCVSSLSALAPSVSPWPSASALTAPPQALAWARSGSAVGSPWSHGAAEGLPDWDAVGSVAFSAAPDCCFSDFPGLPADGGEGDRRLAELANELASDLPEEEYATRGASQLMN